METVKNLLHNLTSKNDENVDTTGTGQTPGEGSHFAGAKDTTSTNPLTGTSATTSNTTSSNPLTGTSANTSNTANTSGLSGTTGTRNEPFSGEGTHLQSSTNTGTTSGLSGQNTSGVTGTGQSSHVPGEWVDDSSNAGTSQVPGSNTTTGSHVGRDAALLGGAGAVGSGIGEHGNAQRDLPIRSNETSGLGSSTSNYPSTAGTTGLGSSDPAYTSSTGTSGLGSSDPAYTSTTGTSGVGSSDPAYTSTTGTSGVGSSDPAYSSTTGTSGAGSSHLGRDAAIGGAGLGGAGLAAHEHNKHNEREFPLSSTTGASHATGQPSSTGYTDATQPSSTGYTGPGTSGVSHHTGPTGSGLHTSGPHSTDTANLLDPQVNTSSVPTESAHHHSRTQGGGAEEADQHHGARNGVGALGAAGLAKHEHDKHRTTGTDAGLGQTSSDYPTSSSTTNPSSSSQVESDEALARRLQAEENARGTSTTSGATSGLGQTNTQDHHYGRDAGVGAGALGAAGLAEHERNSSTASALPGPAPNTAGPHKSDLLNKLDPRVKANPDTTASGTSGGNPVVGGVTGPAAAYGADHTQHEKYETEAQRAAVNNHKRELADQNKDHHYGRDAAVAGGVGGAAYEADKHHNSARTDPYQSISPPGSTAHPISGAGAGTTTSNDPYYGTSQGATTTGGQPGTYSGETGTGHHYGRDAAGVGAVGAGAYGLDKHHDSKELKKEHRAEEKEEKREVKDMKKEHKQEEKAIAKEEKAEKKEAKKEEKEEKKEAKAEQKAEKKEMKAEQKEEKKEEKAEQKELKKEHKAEEKDAKKEHKAEEKDLKHQQKEEKKEHKHGFLSFLHRDKSKKYSKEQEEDFDRQEREHNARNAALGTGAVGAGAYEADKHHASHGTAQPTTSGAYGSTPLDQKPVGSDLGDKLHGSDRNRGVPGESGLPGTAGYGTGVHSEATTDQYGQPIGSGVTGSSTTGTGSHLGRDAALGGGAGALAAHEHNKHATTGTGAGYPSATQQGQYTGTETGAGYPSSTQQGQYSAQGQYPSTAGTSGTGYSQGIDQGKTTSNTPSTTGIYEGHQSSTGTTGASGLQRNESYDPYSTRNDQSVLGQENETGTGSSGVLGSRVNPLSGRNRLHKDPPADHPAALSQDSAHVPASGAERQNLVQQGEGQLNNDTGVAYGHGSQGPTY